MARSHRFRRRHRTPDDVQMNLAAMLDMAFQLLAFLILTFRPSATESAIGLRLPAELPVTKGAAASMEIVPEVVIEEPETETLSIQVHSTVDGKLESVTFGQGVTVSNLDQLRTELQALFGGASSFGQVFLNIEPSLHYQYVVQLIDVCAGIKLPNGENLTQIGFGELAGDQ